MTLSLHGRSSSSNIVWLGLPRSTLGAAVPSLVIVFDSLTLWTLVSISVDWPRSLVLSTLLAAITTPLLLSLMS